MVSRTICLICLWVGACHTASMALAEAVGTSRGEVRDVVLLLDRGPLHLRVRISLGGQPLSSLRQAYVDRLIRILDVNGDGKLSRAETARSPLLRRKQRDSARAFLDSLRTPQTTSRRDIFQTVERVGGETVTYRQDNSTASNDDQLFQFLDTDSSGLLDSAEMAGAVQRLLEKDTDDDRCVSFAELLPEPEPEVEPENPQVQNDRAALRRQFRRSYATLERNCCPSGWSTNTIKTMTTGSLNTS